MKIIWTTINKSEYQLLDAAYFTGCAFLDYSDREEYEHNRGDDDTYWTLRGIKDFNDWKPVEGKLKVCSLNLVHEMLYFLDEHLDYVKEECKCPPKKREFIGLGMDAFKPVYKMVVDQDKLKESKKIRQRLYRFIKKLNDVIA